MMMATVPTIEQHDWQSLMSAAFIGAHREQKAILCAMPCQKGSQHFSTAVLTLHIGVDATGISADD